MGRRGPAVTIIEGALKGEEQDRSGGQWCAMPLHVCVAQTPSVVSAWWWSVVTIAACFTGYFEKNCTNTLYKTHSQDGSLWKAICAQSECPEINKKPYQECLVTGGQGESCFWSLLRLNPITDQLHFLLNAWAECLIMFVCLFVHREWRWPVPISRLLLEFINIWRFE